MAYIIILFCFFAMHWPLNKFYHHGILYQAMCRDSRMVPGAAATEIELARRLKEFSFKETGCVYLFDLLIVTL